VGRTGAGPGRAAAVDESTYVGGGMGADHPIAWCHEYDGGRAWYSAMGHTSESFQEPRSLAHLLAGIRYAAGQLATRCDPGS
jgi:type 1 glutamine amidotransferase